MIRVDAIWLASQPQDMRAGMDTLLARVIKVFGSAQPHQAYCFANRNATRLKVLMHDGIGVWLAARRLNRGKFVWAAPWMGDHVGLDAEQMQALVLGLPWHRVGRAGAISVL
jgi:transposase